MKTMKEIGLILLLAAAVTLASLVVWPAHGDSASDSLKAYATQTEREYSLPSGMLTAICEQESHWRNVAGRHGEIGICQLKPSTVAMICPDCVGNAKGQVFTLGSRGGDVARIQAVLAHLGHYKSAVDGVYGALTHQAVLDYQHAALLATDGIVGPRTWGKLFGSQDPFPGQSITESLWDPHQNIQWAARYLVWLRDNVADDPVIMIAAYNGGPANSVVLYMKRVKARIGVKT